MKKRLVRRKKRAETGREAVLPPATVREELRELAQRRMLW
jgi:hypothetical protein